MNANAKRKHSTDYYLGMLNTWLITSRAPEQVRSALREVQTVCMREEMHVMTGPVDYAKLQETLTHTLQENARADDTNIQRCSAPLEIDRKGFLGGDFEICTDCNGNGGYGSGPGAEQCHKCGGIGKKPAAAPAGTLMDAHRNAPKEHRDLDESEAQQKFPHLTEISKKESEYAQRAADMLYPAATIKDANKDEKGQPEKRTKAARSTWTEERRRLLVQSVDEAIANNDKPNWTALGQMLETSGSNAQAYYCYLKSSKQLDKYRDQAAQPPAAAKPVQKPARLEESVNRGVNARLAEENDKAPQPVAAKYSKQYAGKRDPKQQLRPEDWPDIRDMMKNYPRSYIANSYDVERETLDAFIEEHSAGELSALQS